MARKDQDFHSIRSEGGLVPTDLLRRLLDPKERLPGSLPEDYGLPKGERFNEIITQAWNRLRKHWAEFRSAEAGLPDKDPGTGLTNDKWTLPLLRELEFGPLPSGGGPEIDGRTYAINRFAGPAPVHLVGCHLSLDRRVAGVRGAAVANPHGLVQEFLNRSTESLWGIVSNGLRLRILRDNQALSRQSFLEFDLEAIFDGELYSDFVLFWLVAHASRFSPRDGGPPETCWLEQWTKIAEEQGTRALGELRSGVERALEILGEGFTGHPKNTVLRDDLRMGRIMPSDLHSQLLRVIYRMIFLFVAEDRAVAGRSLLHPRDDSEAASRAQQYYAENYSAARLRELADRIKGSRHGDLWKQFQILVGALSGESEYAASRERLALPALGSFLWNPAATPAVNDAELSNYDFLEALRYLAFTRQGKVRRPVDFKNLGAEELGGVYESLLALTPQISADGSRFSFKEFAGSERKMSGSYYTPDSLVQCLLDSALDPVVNEAIKGKTGQEAEKAILSLKICDPAVGSGHFLVGAAHRLARRLARVRALASGESEPSPLAHQQALRDVIGRCLYGVDINPMAAELCRVSLWLEALEPGKPLSFLDHHIRVGNSLLGTNAELIAGGIPDEAYDPIEGDDKKLCSLLKRQNRKERAGQLSMMHLMVEETRTEYNSIESRARSIDDSPDATLDDIKRKAEQFNRLVVSPEFCHAQLTHDAWCAAFVWKKAQAAPDPLTTDTIRRLSADPQTLSPSQRSEVERLAIQYRFFHWKLAFPEVFQKGGFDCVLGNPPWESINADPVEFFGSICPEIAAAENQAKRDRLTASLRIEKPAIFDSWVYHVRHMQGLQLLLKSGGRFPYGSYGKTNTFPLFTELCLQLMSARGRAGIIVKTAIATDHDYNPLFSSIIQKHQVSEIIDFENKLGIFPDVHKMERFCLLTLVGSSIPIETIAVAFNLHKIEQVKPGKIKVSIDQIEEITNGTYQLPAIKSAADLQILTAISSNEDLCSLGTTSSGWEVEFGILYDGGKLTEFALTLEDVPDKQFSSLVPVYEGKLFSHLNHRAATYEGIPRNRRFGKTPAVRDFSSEELKNPSRLILPRYWITSNEAKLRLQEKGISVGWSLMYGRKASANNARSIIAAICPGSISNDTAPLLFFPNQEAHEAARRSLLLAAVISSFVFDFLARVRTVGTTYGKNLLEQLLVPKLPIQEGKFTIEAWSFFLIPRVLELVYTAWDLEPLARDCGWNGPPFRWDEERRFLMRCELDAAFFHLYLPLTADGEWKLARKEEGGVRDESSEDLAGLKEHFPTPRDAVAYIMDQFPIVRRKDEAKWGEFRTKNTIIEIYDEMAQSIKTGTPYKTRLDPPPADPRCCHPPRQ